MDESSLPGEVVRRSDFVFILILTEMLSLGLACQHGEKNFLKYFLKLVVVKAYTNGLTHELA